MKSLRVSRSLCATGLAVILSGCATPKSLSTVERKELGQFSLNPKVDSPSRPSVSTISGTRAREAGAGGGLIGAIIGETTAAVSSTDEKQVLSVVRQKAGAFEPEQFKQAFERELRQAGYPSDPGGSLVMALAIVNFGLFEVRRDYYAPILTARAVLKTPDGRTRWSAIATSFGVDAHTVNEYQQRPAMYCEAFQQVSDDVAHQLIVGPVRPLRIN